MKRPTAEMSDAKSEPTPGPWRVHETPTGINVAHDVPYSHGGRMVCRMTISPLSTHANTGRANARLIAAAPALLEALKRIAAITNKSGGGDWDEIEEAREIARAAINLAEGL
jgi:hypothetical protein